MSMPKKIIAATVIAIFASIQVYAQVAPAPAGGAAAGGAAAGGAAGAGAALGAAVGGIGIGAVAIGVAVVGVVAAASSGSSGAAATSATDPTAATVANNTTNKTQSTSELASIDTVLLNGDRVVAGINGALAIAGQATFIASTSGGQSGSSFAIVNGGTAAGADTAPVGLVTAARTSLVASQVTLTTALASLNSVTSTTTNAEILRRNWVLSNAANDAANKSVAYVNTLIELRNSASQAIYNPALGNANAGAISALASVQASLDAAVTAANAAKTYAGLINTTYLAMAATLSTTGTTATPLSGTTGTTGTTGTALGSQALFR